MTFNFNNMNMYGFGNMSSMNPYSSNCYSSNIGSMFGSNIFSCFSSMNGMFGSNIFSCFPFMNSMFGNNIFGGGLFTNCYGMSNYGAIAGFSVANMLMNFCGGLINMAITNKMAAKAEASNYTADMKNIKAKINEKLGELGRNEGNYTNEIKLDESFTNAVVDAKNKVDTLKSQIDQLPKLVRDNFDDEASYNQAKQENDTKLKDLNKQLKEAEAALKKAEDAKEAEEKNVAKLKKLQSEIKTLIEQRDELQAKIDAHEAKINDKILDKADGNKCMRTNEEDYQKLFKDNSNELAGDVTVKKRHVRYAILKFRNAKTDDEKRNVAQAFKNLYGKLSADDKNDKNLSAAYDIISKYV